MFYKKLKLFLLVLLFSSCSHLCTQAYEREIQDTMNHAVKIRFDAQVKRVFLVDKTSVIVPVAWVGSGVVLDAEKSGDKEMSLIMTAAHITDIPHFSQGIDAVKGPYVDIAEQEAITLKIIRLDEKECEGTVIKSDSLHDVATVLVDCYAGIPASLSDEFPPPGARLTTVGAPRGISGDGWFVVVEGNYLGLDGTEIERMVSTVPAIFGSSGSGVFHRGHVVGILSRVYNDFHHVSQSVNLKWCQKLYYESLLTLHERERASAVPDSNP